MQIHRWTAIGGWLECGLERDSSSMEWTDQKFCCKCPRQHMVLHHLQKLLEFGETCCQFACASVGSTFALLASFWHSTCEPSTKHLRFKTWCVLPICESWMLERCGIGHHPMELTSWFVCRFLPHVNSSCVHIFTFCGLRPKTGPPLACRPDLTWTVRNGTWV